MTRRGLIAAAALLLATVAGAAAEDAALTIDHAWARATPGKAQNGAAYFTVTSTGGDRLLAVATPVAQKAEVHENIDEKGVMKMRPAGPLTLEPGKPVELKPGGYHVMLIGLKQPLKEGETFPLTLTFEKAGTREVTVAIGKAGAMGMSHGDMMQMAPKKTM
jgi:copper(I)-binding protein